MKLHGGYAKRLFKGVAERMNGFIADEFRHLGDPHSLGQIFLGLLKTPGSGIGLQASAGHLGETLGKVVITVSKFIAQLGQTVDFAGMSVQIVYHIIHQLFIHAAPLID